MDYKKIRLNKKITLYLVALILLVVVSIGVSVNIIFEKKFSSYISINNQKEISNLVDSLELEYKNNTWNLYNINNIGKDSLSKGRMLEIYDSNNNLIWSAFKYNNRLCHQTMNNIKSNMSNRYPKWNGKYNEEKYNLNSNKDYIGYVKIGYYGPYYYMDNELNFLSDINKVIIIIAAVTIIITIIIAIIISNSISNPIYKVSRMTKLIKNGGYNNKLKYRTNIVEIDELIHSINDLAYELEEQENLRKRLTTDISHELRTPLTNVQTHLEAIIDGIWEPTGDRLNSINEEVIRLTSLVNQLKNLAKYDSEKNILNLTQVNLKNLIINIIYNNEGIALEKNIKIDYDLEDTDALVDKIKISQLIVNLLSNAIRYTKENGQIYIRLYKEQDNIKIHVKDNGIGIPKDSIKYVFERFYRVDKSRSKSSGGIGVGLTICKSIADLHKGSIDVKSEINVGSEFIVTLPLKIKSI